MLNRRSSFKIAKLIRKGGLIAFQKIISYVFFCLGKYQNLSATRRQANLILFSFLWVVVHSGIPAQANPENGNVVSGSATITVDGKKLDVMQTTDKAVIDWRTFNIQIDEHTQFHQPNAGSIALNRVTSADPSQILGRLSANGNIILINPNGVFFGANSRVDVNGLIASTADINNKDFMDGRLNFLNPGNPNAIIRNDGIINAKEAGLVGLVAPIVENNGIISAKLGKVSLASGDTFTLDMYGDNLINVAVSGNLAKQAIKNTGKIEAAGGRIALTAAAGRDIVDSLIEVKGELKAPAVAEKNGKIIIYAEGSNAVKDVSTKGAKLGKSTVLVDGKINASGKGVGEKGGSVEIYGDQVGLLANTEIDTSGSVGGGNVNVGGDYQGSGDKPKALATYVDHNAVVNSGAIDNGNAGDVVFWADDATRYYGTTYARGGVQGGNGGLVEVSGKNYLDFHGNVDTSAAVGETGNLLLDPGDINICLFGSSSLAACNPTGSPSLTAVSNIFDSGANATSYVDIGTTGTVGSLLNLLNSNNVTVRTNASGAGAGGGDITVHDAISIAAANTRTLTLQAHDKIFINAPITVRNLTLTANDLDINAAINSNSAGNGTLTMQPFTASTTVGVGGGSGTLNISDTDISNIQSGWLNVVVGSAVGTGQMNVDSSSWLSHTTLQTQTGLLNVLGAQSLASTKNLTIQTRNLTLGSTLSGTGTLTIRPDSNAITMGLGTGAVGTLNLDNSEVANIQDGWGLLSFGLTTSTSALNINALTWNDNVQLNTATGLLTITGNQTLSANNLTIQTGNLTIGANLSGTGTLTIRPDTNRTVGIGTGAVGVLNLDDTELGFIQDGWSQINLGLSTSTSAMNVNAFTWSDNVQFLTSTGLMTISGNQTLGANNLTIQTSNLALNSQLSGTGTLTIQPQGNTAMGVGTGAAGTLSLDDTELGQIQDGWSQINLGSTANTQLLTVAGRTWTDDVAFRTSTGGISITGDQNSGSSNLTFSGAVTLSGNRTIDAGSALISFTSTITGAGNSLTVNSTNTATNAINFGSTVSGVNVLDVNGKAQTNGNVTTTGNMTFAHTLNLNANTTLNAGAGTISLKDVTANNRTLAFGGAGSLTLNGNITSSGIAINFNRATTLAGNTSVDLAAGNVTFSNTVNGGNNLTLLGTGAKTFSSIVGGVTPIGALNVTGNTTLSTSITTNNSNITFNSPVTLGANSVINSGTANTTFSGTVNGARTLNITSGNTVFGGAVGNTTPLIGLTVNGPASLAGNVTLNNAALSISGLTTLTGNSTLSTGTGNITLAGVAANTRTLAFAGTGGLTLNGDIISSDVGINFSRVITLANNSQISTGLGNITLTGVSAVGNTFTLAGTGGLTMSGTFNSGGSAFDFNRNVTLSGATIVNSGVGDTAFGGTINGNANLTLTAATTTFNGIIGGTTPIGNLTVNGTANVGNNITANNAATITFNNNLNLTGDAILRTNSAIALNDVSSVAGKNLTLNTNTTPVFSGAVAGINSAGGTLTIQPNTNNTTIGIAGGAGTMNLSSTLLGKIGSGWAQLQIGSATGTGLMTVGANTWGNNILLRTNTGAISITANQILNSNSLTFAGTGGLTLGGDISTSGTSLTFNRAVTLSGNRTIDSGSGLISFTNTSPITGATNSLTLNSTNTAVNAISFGAAVSGVNVLNVNGKAQTNANITTTGNMTFGNTLNLNTNTTLNAGAGTISLKDVTANNKTLAFGGAGGLTLDGNISSTDIAINFNRIITLAGNSQISTGAGNITLTGVSAVGNTFTLAGTGGLTMSGTFNSGGSAFDFNRNVTLSGATIVNSGVGNTIFGGTINGNANLTLTAAATTFGGVIGGTTPIGILTVNGTANVGNNITTNNTAVTFNNAMNLTGDSTIRTNAAITLNSVSSSAGKNLTLNTNTTPVFAGSAGSINSAGGTLTIQPNTNTTTIGVAGGAGAMNLSTALLGKIGSGWSLIQMGSTTGTGAVTVNAYSAWANNILFRSNTGAITLAGAQNFNGFNATIETDSNLAINSTIASSGGILTLRPRSAGTTIGLAGAVGTFNLSVAELNNISDGWSAINIGRSDSTSSITMNAYSNWRDPINFITSGTGAINVTGGAQSSAGGSNASLTFSGPTNISFDINSGTNALTFNNSLAANNTGRTVSAGGNLTLNTVNLGANNFTINTDGDLILNNSITGSGVLTIQGLSAATTMGIGNGSVGTLNLTDTELSRITDGFSQLTFGSATATGAIDVRAATWNDNATFRTLSGTISINGNQTLGANNLAFVGTGGLNLGADITTFNTAVNFNRAVTLTGNSTINTGTASTTFGNTVNGSFGLTTTASNTVFNNVVGGSTALASLTVNSAASVTGNITTSGNMNFTGALTFLGNSAMNSGSGKISLVGVTGGGNSLTLTSSNLGVDAINFGGAVSGVNVLNVNGLAIVANNITTTGNLAFSSALVLSGSSSMNSGASKISLVGVTGGGNNLTLTSTNTSNDAINLAGQISGVNNLSVVGKSTISNDISTTGILSLSDLASMNGNRTISSVGNMILNAVSLGANNFTINTDGDLVLNNNITGSGALTIQGLSAATTMGIGNGSVGTLNLTDTELSRITNGFSQLTFGSAAATGAIDVRAATWNDDVTFRTLSGTISINGNQTLGANNLAFVGTGGLNLGANITTFNTAVNFNRAVTLTGNSTINTGTASTTFSNTVNGSFGLTTTASNTVFNNAVGGSTALASLTVNSAASVADNIKTTGNMSFANTLILGGNITLDSGTSTMALASVTGAGNNLTLNSTSTSTNAINLSGVISGVGILNVNGKSTIANNITTTGNINFAGALTLAGNSTMNTGAGAITYGDTINGAFDLITTANNTIFNGIVGGGTALSSLTVSGPASISSNITTSNGAVSISGLTTLTSSSLISTGSGNITLVGVAAGNNTLAFAGTGGLTMSGNYTSTNTAMNFNRDVILSGATSISTGSGAVNFKKVDGAQNLTVNTIGNITFSDSVGSANRLGTVTITNANNVSATSFKSGSFTQSAGTGATNFSGAGLNTTNNISITSNGITGTYFGIGGQLHSGSGNINATVTFDTLNISGVLANLLAGKIGGSTTVNQNMANLISINGVLYPSLVPSSNYKFAGFTIGASIPTTTPTPVVISNTSNVILPDTVQAEGDDLIEEEEQEESQIQQDIQGCGKNFDDSAGCKKLDKSSPIEYHSKN